MNSTPPNLQMPETPTVPSREEQSEDLRRMAPIYIAVIVVEVAVLIGLWVFQTIFS